MSSENSVFEVTFEEGEIFEDNHPTADNLEVEIVKSGVFEHEYDASESRDVGRKKSLRSGRSPGSNKNKDGTTYSEIVKSKYISGSKHPRDHYVNRRTNAHRKHEGLNKASQLYDEYDHHSNNGKFNHKNENQSPSSYFHSNRKKTKSSHHHYDRRDTHSHNRSKKHHIPTDEYDEKERKYTSRHKHSGTTQSSSQDSLNKTRTGEIEKLNYKDKSPSDTDANFLPNLLVVNNPLDVEEQLIEERRKRRLEILKKHERAVKKKEDEDKCEDEIAPQIVFGTEAPSIEIFDDKTVKSLELVSSQANIVEPRILGESDIIKSGATGNKDEPNDDMFLFDEKSTCDPDNDEKNKIDGYNNSGGMDNNNISTKDTVEIHQNIDNMALKDNWDDNEGYYRSTVGEKLNNRYLVVKLLGKGVFSSVVLANDLLDGGNEVAVKIIRNNETMYRAGMNELSILKNLMAVDPEGKKHIVNLLGNFEYRNHLCLVFENLSMNLRDVLKEYGKDIGLNIRAVKVYAQQLLIALSLLKKCNILHADIKPDNILVNSSMNILKLCDLGSATEVDNSEITPYLVSRFYRAPEIILGLPHKPSLDIWSVACTLYELYTGKFLFPGKTNNHMLKLMMDLKGKFPNKVLRKGLFTHKYFDEDLNFLKIDDDKVTGKEIKRKVIISRPTRDLRDMLEKSYHTHIDHDTVNIDGKKEAETTLLSQFIDFLDKALRLNPEKRITVRDALLEPFINKPCP